MDELIQENLNLDISKSDWAMVHRLIEEVQEEEERNDFLKALMGWYWGARLFRAAEEKYLIQKEPGQQDLIFHESILHLLIGIGLVLKQGITPEIEKHTRLTDEEISATIRALKHSRDEWHSDVTRNRMSELKNSIFGVPA